MHQYSRNLLLYQFDISIILWSTACDTIAVIHSFVPQEGHANDQLGWNQKYITV
jgi:hypothetical protein